MGTVILNLGAVSGTKEALNMKGCDFRLSSDPQSSRHLTDNSDMGHQPKRSWLSWGGGAAGSVRTGDRLPAGAQ